MLMLYFLFILPSVYSFLLDTPQGNGGASTTNQYLTLSKFYEEMKFQQEEVHRDTTKLRHDTDNSLALLTTQLQQKFDLLDKKLIEIEGLNQTIPDFHNLEQKYIQLEQKYIQLEQKYLKNEQNYNTLKLENNLLQNKKNQMENELFSLRNETNHQGQELAMLKNKTLSVDQNIKELKTLRNIKPLQELTTLQQEVRSISTQTNSLNMKEQARSQDVLALYNQVREQGANSTRLTKNLDTKIKTLQKNFADIESKVDEATITENQTLIHLQQQIDKNMELVAMTAHPLSSTNKAGIIKFDDVKFTVGINNLLAYTSTGKFTCENDGLYLISASIMSNAIGAYYRIYLNGNIMSYTKIGYNNQGISREHTGTVVVGLQLHANDSMWVYNAGNNNIYAGVWSTLTIVKIK